MTEPERAFPLPSRGPGRHRYVRPTRADIIAQRNAQARIQAATYQSLPLAPRARSPFPGAAQAAASASGAAALPGAGTHRTEPLPSPRARANAEGSARLADGAPAAARQKSPLRRPIDEGSLARASMWTTLGSIIPGFGLTPTRWRPLGVTIMALLVLGTGAVAAWAFTNDVTTTLITLGTKRWFLTLLLAAVAVGALLWIGLIAFTNHLQNLREHLRGASKVASMALAYTFILIIALPATHAVHSLYAAQSIIGSSTVFSTSGNTENISTGKDPWADTERINVMLLGQDAGADRTGTRPDTIMVASIDTKSGRTALFSIPRNLQYVRFPEGSAPAQVFPNGFDYYGKNQNLINAVWTWAEEVRPDLFPGDPRPGYTATKMVVEETLGLTVDYYAMVNLKGFQDLVDAVGGVDIEVERNIPIGGGNSPVEGYVEKGWQHLDGYHALWYARSREGSSDFDRNCRQQRMVRTVAEEANVTSVVLAFPRLVSATERNIETDIPAERLDAFTELGLRVQKGGFKSYPINPTVTPSGNPDYPFLKEWVQASIADSMAGVDQGAESVRGDGGVEASEQPAGEDTGEAAPAEEPQATEEASEQPAAPEAPAAPAIQVNQDPLAACMPGNDDPRN
ncbi:MAG: LCP family protein [Dermabacter sp.]|nr:LCP family protein [Dermabacter sp.]